MDSLLDNPVFNALTSRDAHRGHGTDEVKYFEREISPFAGFKEGYLNGFSDLYNMLPAGREILYAGRMPVDMPAGWKPLRHIEGTQFLFTPKELLSRKSTAVELVPLEAKHADEMVALAALTRPGPFDKRTIEFGHYFGVFEDGRLAAMTGQRLHVHNYTEVSAVCTHPDFLGKGYASLLLDNAVDIILKAGQTPFLHVKADNERAIFLYERMGFRKNGPMNFYFMRKD